VPDAVSRLRMGGVATLPGITPRASISGGDLGEIYRRLRDIGRRTLEQQQRTPDSFLGHGGGSQVSATEEAATHGQFSVPRQT
jgi:hypothetical protein